MNIVNPTRTMIELDEEKRASQPVAACGGRLPERVSPHANERWCWMSERAPENVTLQLQVLRDGVTITVDGWCSYRFLRGHATYWAWWPDSTRAEIVMPRRWIVKA